MPRTGGPRQGQARQPGAAGRTGGRSRLAAAGRTTIARPAGQRRAAPTRTAPPREATPAIGEAARPYLDNFVAVATHHPNWAALGLPTSAAALRENFPELVRYMPQSGAREAWERYFGTGDAAYTGSSSGLNYNEINGMLRTGRLPGRLVDSYRKAVIKLAMGMAPLPPGTVFYRGISLRHNTQLRNLCQYLDRNGLEAFERYTGTRRFQDKGIISTSRAEAGAGQFVLDKPESVLLIITTASTARGRVPASTHTGDRFRHRARATTKLNTLRFIR